MTDFLVDIQLDGSPETSGCKHPRHKAQVVARAMQVLQVPVSRTGGAYSVWAQVRAAQRLLSDSAAGDDAAIEPDTLDAFLQRAGALFGKDANKWDLQGKPLIDCSEQNLVRTIKKTEIFWGLSLRLFQLAPWHHPLLRGLSTDQHGAETYDAARDYSERRIEVADEAAWQRVTAEEPSTDAVRRRQCMRFLQAKLRSGDSTLVEEGLHGVWELCIKRHTHAELPMDVLRQVVAFVRHEDVCIAQAAAAVLWALAPSSDVRGDLVALKGVAALHELLVRTLQMDEAAGDCTRTRDQPQAFALGALALLLLDARCREQLLDVEPTLKHLLLACEDLPGYAAAVQEQRRKTAARVLMSCVQRDGYARQCVVEQGQLKAVIALLDTAGTGAGEVRFCMASALAVLILDEDIMEAVRARGEAPAMFVHSIAIVRSALAALAPDAPAPPDDPAGTVAMAEATAQAMWGAAYYCTLPGGGGIEDAHVVSLGEMGAATWANEDYPLGRVAHCIAATLASLASDAHCARVLMANNAAHCLVQTLMLLVRVYDRGVFQSSGHVRAAAACALSFLACHDTAATGDACLVGPYRTELLEQGALDCLLQAALAPPEDTRCCAIVEMAASVGIMYLATMAGDLSAATLVMLASLLNNHRNLLMVENLMAAVWILLRRPHNRALLSTAFSDNPVLGATLKGQMQDVVDVHEVHEGITNAMSLQKQRTASVGLQRASQAPAAEPSAAGTASRSASLQRAAAAAQAAEDAGGGDAEAAAGGAHDTAKPASAGMSTTSKRTMTPEADLVAIDTDKLEDASTEDWGLDMLVRVGEAWASSLLTMTTATLKAPLLKLFEFLVASMCLFLIDDDEPLASRRRGELFARGRAQGCAQRPGAEAAWWTIAAPRAAAAQEEEESRAHVHAYEILCVCLTMQIPQAWKIMQLALLTLWNVTARRPWVERHVVAQGVAIALMDVATSPVWPHSLRYMAAGFLTALHDGGHAPEHTGGLVPLCSTCVALLRSDVPLLEMAGARALARILSAPPHGAANPAAAVRDAKAVATHQGAASALVRLLQLVLGRYTALRGGATLPPAPFPLLAMLEDDPSKFTRDMSNEAGLLDTLYYTCAALLNLSALRVSQLVLARRGLATLLGAQSLLAAAVHAAGDAAPPLERRAVELLVATVHNLAQHPQNRTRFYKAELRGVAALQSELLRQGRGTRSASPQRRLPRRGAPARSASPQKGAPMPPMPPPRAASEAWRPLTWVPAGAVDLARSVDSTLPDHLHPKATFPTISRPAPAGADAPASAEVAAQADAATVARADREDAAVVLAEEPSTAALFTAWVDCTFQAHASEEARAATPAARGRAMVDPATGEWQNERHGLPLLARALRRPAAAMWADGRGARALRGAARWRPEVSEYRAGAPDAAGAPVHAGAARLMRTNAPDAAEVPLAAAAAAAAGEDGALLLGAPVLRVRPSTAERRGGRVPLTVLRVDGADDGAELADGADQGQSPPRAPAAPGVELGTLPLTVALSPQRSRTAITFAGKLAPPADAQRPALAVFGHEPGSRVYEGLFPKFQLPNGKQAFFYYTGGGLQDEEAVELLAPPGKPDTVPGALQDGMPLASVMDAISKPPGSAPPFAPAKPRPRLVPLPERHTLAVRRPHDLSAPAFGDLRPDHLQFVIEARRLIRTVVTTREESVEAALPVEREAWALPKSIFAPRAKRGPQQSDAKDYVDTAKVIDAMFDNDWKRLMAKEKFAQNFLARECRNSKETSDSEAEQVEGVRAAFREQYASLVQAFAYYSASVSAAPFFMGLNEFTAFLDECRIPDNEVAGVKRSDLDTIFIVCTRKEKAKDGKAVVGSDNALFRYEWLEALARIAIAKYGKTHAPAAAVAALLREHVECHVAPLARVELNAFRTRRLYCEAVDELLKRHEAALAALYSRWRLRPAGGGLRTKMLKADGWMKLIEAYDLVDDDFPLSQAVLCFVWARMATVDEVRDYGRFESLTFVDFLEALALVAELKHLPTASDLADAGLNMLQWAQAKATGDTSAATAVPTLFQNADAGAFLAAHARPLAAKLALLLDLIFRRVVHDPSDASGDASADRVLRTLKKQDHDLGS